MAENITIMDIKDAYDQVDEAVNNFNDGVEKVDQMSDFAAYTAVYNDPNSTPLMKRYCGIKITEDFFELAGEYVDPIYGGSILNFADFDPYNDAKRALWKSILNNQLAEAEKKALDDGNDQEAENIEKMRNNLDDTYDAFMISLEEQTKDAFPNSKKEWDKFHAKYQENYDRIMNPQNFFEWWNQKWMDFGSWLYDTTHPVNDTVPTPSIDDISSNSGITDSGTSIEDVDSGAGIDGYGDEIDDDEVHRRKLTPLKPAYDRAKDAVVPVYYDPLMLDLDGNGLDIATKEQGAYFDLDKNGFAERMNWSKTDGFLCLDLNGNGKIDDGGELFGDQTALADGTNAKICSRLVSEIYFCV